MLVPLWTTVLALATLTSADPQFNVTGTANGFAVFLRDLKIMEQTPDHPAVFVGKGTTTFTEYRGNFDIRDFVEDRIGLEYTNVTSASAPTYVIHLSLAEYWVELKLQPENDHPLVVSVQNHSSNFDRMWLRLVAEKDEMVFGGGEQYSFLNLRGRAFPIWTREQGVGRNKSDLVTFYSDKLERSGGDYHTTYFPQPTLLSSRMYYCHHSGTDYAVLDFQSPDFHELYFLGRPGKLYFQAADTYRSLVTSLTQLLGRMPQLPDWVHDGVILGVQGGTQQMLNYLQQAKEAGMKVSGLWIQDWCGRLDTSFGKRLFWDWKWNQELYPNLDQEIIRLKQENIRVLGYINPNLNTKGTLYREADSKGYLVKNSAGQTLQKDFGEFYCGTVDLTNPAAYNWYKDNVLKKNMIDLGLGGWMADFGEYLPVEAKMLKGDARQVHNDFPRLWAQCNRDALEETSNVGDILFFMRAGSAGSGNASVMMWAGDQDVDWSYGDGLPSTIPAALNMGLSGVGLTHFDVGGYTTFQTLGLVRSPELLLRSAEMAVFSPVFRTHEGNQPQANAQFYSNPSLLAQFARLSKLFVLLGNYSREVVTNTSQTGEPAQRPLFFNYQSDVPSRTVTYQYMYGDDVLVAPVIKPNVSAWDVYLPLDTAEWVFFWNNTAYTGGRSIRVDAPIGQPPAFYRSSSPFAPTFRRLALEVLPPVPTSHPVGSGNYTTAGIVTGVVLAAACYFFPRLVHS